MTDRRTDIILANAVLNYVERPKSRLAAVVYGPQQKAVVARVLNAGSVGG